MSESEQVIDQSITIENEVNNALQAIYATALTEIPIVGGVLSSVFTYFWPNTIDGEDAWQEIVDAAKQAIEQYVDKEITESDVNSAEQALEGLGNTVKDYLQVVQSDPPFSQEENWNAYYSCVSGFDEMRPLFQKSGDEVAFLPLYVHVVLLEAIVRRDAVQYPDTFGLVGQQITDQQNDLTNLCSGSHDWVYQTIDDLLAKQSGWNDYTNCRSVMLLAAGEFQDIIDLMSDIEFVGPLLPSKRELYSPLAIGDGEPHPPSSLESAEDKPLIDGIQLWGWSNVDAVRQSYDGEWGPRMGDKQTDGWGGTDSPSQGYHNNSVSPDNPITGAGFTDGGGIWLNTMYITYKNGSKSNTVGGFESTPGVTSSYYEIPGYVVSQIWAYGSQDPNSNDTYAAYNAIVGFRLEASYQ